ncbi:MAG: class I SAM-dependent methyltransferase [Deltaproteobacteria bacterium]|nr:class I SAM-dependent methyltransferase [Deltaproteobacteria bacterium]
MTETDPHKAKDNSYADYFIKDGKHLGLYEEMYAKCPDPWRIEELGLRLDMQAALLLLGSSKGPFPRVLDLGAGAGFFSLAVIEELLKAQLMAESEAPSAEEGTSSKPTSIIEYFLVDMSQTALNKALEKISSALQSKGKMPLLKLKAIPLDLRELDLRAKEEKLLLPSSFDLVILAQTLWGILENLENTLIAINRLLAPQGSFLISQHFPKDQKYGKDILKSPEELIDYLLKTGFSPLRTIETDRNTNHHFAVLSEKKSTLA